MYTADSKNLRKTFSYFHHLLPIHQHNSLCIVLQWYFDKILQSFCDPKSFTFLRQPFINLFLSASHLVLQTAPLPFYLVLGTFPFSLFVFPSLFPRFLKCTLFTNLVIHISIPWACFSISDWAFCLSTNLRWSTANLLSKLLINFL